jgi:DNA-directed RNA polymerase subunit A"
VAELNVTLGLPRIIEIFDARKDPKTPSMTIYLKEPHNKTRQAAEKIAAKVKEVTLKELAKEIISNLAELSITIILDKDEMTLHETTPEQVAAAIEKQTKAKIERSGMTLKVTSKDQDIKKIYRFKEKLKEINVAGVKNVTDVLPIFRKDTEEFAIQTFGTNLKDVLPIEGVDGVRTTSNNLIEINKVLGIEAARQAVINEVNFVLQEQGVSVDIRHIMLVADLMSMSGEVKGITRHGITSQKTSVLARASFEIPLKHLIDASIVGETDKLTSVVENVMINQPVPVGTGLPGLVVRFLKEKK